MTSIHNPIPNKANPYHVLSLPNFASEAQIKKKYRQLILVLHPDKRRRSSRRLSLTESAKLDYKFHMVQDAKTFLLSEEYRTEKMEYDTYLKREIRLAQTPRRNSANQAFFSLTALNSPYSEGTFRWVSKGTYIQGRRNGQPCVCKWFKSGSVFEDEFFSLDIQAIDKALEIITSWNSQEIIEKLIQVNVPEIWTFEKSSNENWSGAKVLQEPFIENYQKFNSNTGWFNDKVSWARAMQALSHYSYHITNGQYLLCDLQGGISDDSIILTDPVILSRNRRFGVTDLGAKGIANFFYKHKCNSFCSTTWKQYKPRVRKEYFKPKRGTSMMTSNVTVYTRSKSNVK